MKYLQRVERLEEHRKERPKDYQAVIAYMVAKSDLIEHGQYLQMIERKKRLAEVRRRRHGKK